MFNTSQMNKNESRIYVYRISVGRKLEICSEMLLRKRLHHNSYGILLPVDTTTQNPNKSLELSNKN